MNRAVVCLIMPAGGSTGSKRVVGMADVTLRDVDPHLLERIRRLAVARGWTHEQTCLVLLEQGLFAGEQEVRGGFENPEVDALSEAILALKALPAGGGF